MKIFLKILIKPHISLEVRFIYFRDATWCKNKKRNKKRDKGDG